MDARQGITSARHEQNANTAMLHTKDLYAYFLKHPHVQTDTRNLQEGDLFFALKGPHFNGNKFAKEALEKGASYAVIDDPAYQEDEQTLLVSDVLTSLQQLAAYHRQQFDIPFIAITGSNGKTTTKELTYAVLSTTYNTQATKGNLNNHIGIPLTLLRIPKGTEIALIEMGANHQKEIEAYCRIVRPTHGLITNIGKAHLEGFGGIEGVKKGKGELFDFLRATKGTAFVCADFPYFVKEMTKGLPDIHWYGTTNNPPIRGKMIQKHPLLTVQFNGKYRINTHLSGEYNLYNILAAAAIGDYFNVKKEDITSAIAEYRPKNARSQVIHQRTNTFILDAYNANPTSMHAAIKDFSERPEEHQCLFLGAMKELGEESAKEHQELINFIQTFHWEDVILVGDGFRETQHSFLYFPTVEKAKAWFKKQHYQETSILIKGSHSIGMEKILE